MIDPLPASAVILAGGRATRLGGVDKGLFEKNGQALVSYGLSALTGQMSEIFISANRHKDQYETFGYPVFEDDFPDFQGPLGGIISALARAQWDWLFTLPCDVPVFPKNFFEKLWATQTISGAEIVFARHGMREEFLFGLWSKQLLAPARDYLLSGERKLGVFLHQRRHAICEFSALNPEDFKNFNRPEDFI